MRKIKTTEKFIQDVIAVHGDRYDYSLVIYTGAQNKIEILCKKHGAFLQSANNHKHGQGCRECDIESRIMPIELYIQKANKKHSSKYDYSSVFYTAMHNKIKIICPIHGMFEQRAGSHLEGKGCMECRNALSRRTTEQFIHESVDIHGSKYDYSLVDYKNIDTKVDIICLEHGTFKQTPWMHLQKSGCPTCSHHVSHSERQWLDYIGLPDDNDHRQVLLTMNNDSRYSVDGYDPSTNTVYEFHGDFWHGNPDVFDHKKINPTNQKSYQVLYENTIKKESLIQDSGYNLITIWENDWNILQKSA